MLFIPSAGPLGAIVFLTQSPSLLCESSSNSISSKFRAMAPNSTVSGWVLMSVSGSKCDLGLNLGGVCWGTQLIPLEEKRWEVGWDGGAAGVVSGRGWVCWAHPR